MHTPIPIWRQTAAVASRQKPNHDGFFRHLTGGDPLAQNGQPRDDGAMEGRLDRRQVDEHTILTVIAVLVVATFPSSLDNIYVNSAWPTIGGECRRRPHAVGHHRLHWGGYGTLGHLMRRTFRFSGVPIASWRRPH